MEDIDAYRWVDGSSLSMAACLTLVRGVTEAQVLTAFAPDPATGVHPGAPGPLSEDRWADPYAGLVDAEVSDLAAQDRDVLWVLDLAPAGHPGWLLVVEDNGFAGTRQDVVAALGADEHVAAFWNVNAVTRLLVAESGQVLLSEEPTMQVSDPRLARLRRGLELDPSVPGYLPWTQAVLVLLERATGIRVTPDLLSGRATLVTLPDGPAAYVLTMASISPASESLPEPPVEERPARPPRPGTPGAVVPVPSVPAWQAPPEGWLPGQVAVEGLLGRTRDVAVRLARLTVYPSGVEVEVEVARRPGSPDQDIFGDLYQPIDRTGRVRPEILRIDVVFADGRRASSVAPYLDAQRPPDRPVLVPSSGGGSSGTYRQILWLWPLPPPGPLVVSCRWPAVGLESAQLDLDGTVIAAAAARAERLWDAGGAR